MYTHITDGPVTPPRDTVGLVKESSQEQDLVQKELENRKQELEKEYQASLNELRQTLFVNEKKQQEKYHEPVSQGSCREATRWQSVHLKTNQLSLPPFIVTFTDAEFWQPYLGFAWSEHICKSV